ncbi:MAG: PAS domain S-box protein [Maribacter sp.]|nr:PAS domain S-box protein [Maribacter sp.]
MDNKEVLLLKRALERQKKARIQAEKILETKSKELFDATFHLKKANARLEDLLSEKASELDGVFINIIDPYIVMDLNYNVIEMNASAKEFLGYDYTKESINLAGLVHNDYLQYTIESMQSLIKVGTLKNYRAKIITKDKLEKFVQINASLIYNNKGEPIAAQGIIRDITHDHEVKQLLADQKSQLDIIVENSPLGIVLTVDGNIVTANKTFIELIGYSQTELKKFHVKDISAPENISRSLDLMDKMNSGEIDSFVLNKKYKKKDGSFLWAKTNVNAVRNADGKTKYQVAIIEDITLEREKALIIEMVNEVAKAILGKMDIYEIAWEITNIITAYLGSDDCVIYVVNNEKKVLEQIAASGGKVINEKHILNEIQINIGEGIVGNVAKTGKAEIIADTSKDPRYIVDDQQRYSEIAVPIITDGEVIGVIDSEHHDKNYYSKAHLETLHNISRLVAMQLKNAINLRERRKAEERNTELLKKLENSNQGLQEYAHIVSHDLKSPLRSLSALATWLNEDYKEVLDDNGIFNLQMMQERIEGMDKLIDGILKYSSINIENLEYTSVDINEIVQDIREIIFIPSHVNVIIMNTLPKISADKTKIHQLFQNLISNAVVNVEKEEGIVEISSLETATHWQFSIKDNGKGIPKEYHKKIFKIFQSIGGKERSTGIGLSIVKKIVDLYEGEVWLDSAIDEGTTFHFTLKK